MSDTSWHHHGTPDHQDLVHVYLLYYGWEDIEDDYLETVGRVDKINRWHIVFGENMRLLKNEGEVVAWHPITIDPPDLE